MRITDGSGGTIQRRRLIRDFHAGQYLDLFLAAAVTAVLVVRVVLHVTGYPQIGGATLHIAHMLWGGLLMLASIMLLLAYIGRGVHQAAAFTGGVGFGMFIDEVGKFVTQDNDYFYQPAVALIYITFVLTYLAMRSLRREQVASPQDYLVNALQEVENVAVDDLDQQERERGLAYLERSQLDNPLVIALKDVLSRADIVPLPNPHPVARARNAVVRLYRRTALHPGFRTFVIAFFIAQLAFRLLHVTVLLFLPSWGALLARGIPSIQLTIEGFDYLDWIQLGSTLLGGALVALGVLAFRRSRLHAFRMFHRSVLVSIFLTQVFVFYRNEWGALPILTFNLALLAALNFVIDQEAARAARAE